jgi:hypothetical protein
MITILLNFVCTHQARLDTLETMFDGWVRVLADYKFIINYDTNVNYEVVKNLYERNIKKCSFSNDTKTPWVDKTIEMVKSVDTPYIYYLFEDVSFDEIVTKEYFQEMFNEFQESGAKHLMLGKTDKYSNPTQWLKTNCEIHKTIRTFNSNVPYNCLFPVAGIWDTQLFLDVLYHVKNKVKSSNAIKQIDGIEVFSKDYKDKKIKQACPLKKVTSHIQLVTQAKR